MSDLDNSPTRASLKRELECSWKEPQIYLTSLTEKQLTQSADAAGWTAKDHVIHLAIWEKAALAMLEGKSKREVPGITNRRSQSSPIVETRYENNTKESIE